MTAISYRPEIDGLRALSVLSVIFFHAGFSGFSGGYVGVDVFFVISGFLITSIILRERADGTFTIGKFLIRRARRILPALLLLLGVSSVFAWFLLRPASLIEFGAQQVASQLFIVNFWMSGSVDYFSSEAANSPLSHLWSLSLEEQFYLLFPVFLIFVMKGGRTLALTAILAIAFLSLCFSQWSGNLKFNYPYIREELFWYAPSIFADFYMPTGRIWELLVGAMIAFFPRVPFNCPSWIQNLISAFGLLLIGIAVVGFDHKTATPSFSTLFPVVGAALVIVCSGNTGFVNFALTRKPMVFIGLISYSLYLIHQAVFAFARHGDPEFLLAGEIQPFGPGKSVILIGASILLAYLSWRFVEQHWRHSEIVNNRRFFKSAALASLFCISIGVTENLTGGPMLISATIQDRYFLTFDEERLGKYVSRRFSKSKGAFDLSAPTPKIVVIGDSHGQDFANVVGESAWLTNRQLKTIALDNTCTKYFSMSADTKEASGFSNSSFNRDRCIREKAALLIDPNLHNADLIFVAQQWTEAGAEAVGALLEEFAQRRKNKEQKVIIIGKKAFGNIRPEKYIQTPLVELLKTRYKPTNRERNIDDILAQQAGGAHISLFSIICSSEDGCPIFTPQGKFISYDGGHLSKEGAIYISTKIFSMPYFDKIGHTFSENTSE